MMRRFGLILAVLVFVAVAASAQPLTWYVSGVTFNDGGTASGRFNFDPDAGTPCSTGASPCGVYSDVFIVTTTGTLLTGMTYKSPCETDVSICTIISPDSTELLLTSSQTGIPALVFFFINSVDAVPPEGLTEFGGTIDISHSSASVGAAEELGCGRAGCVAAFNPDRLTVAGTVASSETLWQYFAFGG